MKQVFIDERCTLNSSVLLDDRQAHHLFDVLRVQKKESVRVVSRKGGAFLAHPLEKPFLYIYDEIEVPQKAQHITLCISLIKQDKFEQILQKACELGVTRIVPFESRFSIIHYDQQRQQKKLQRWQQIILDACKQCNRNDLAELEPIQKVETLHNYQGQRNIVCYEKQIEISRPLFEVLEDDPSSVTVIIGPEGGFDVNEIDMLLDDHFIPVTLGTRILRCETAAVYALSCIDYHLQMNKVKKQ